MNILLDVHCLVTHVFLLKFTVLFFTIFLDFMKKKMRKINNVIPHCFLAVATSMVNNFYYTLGMMHDVAYELHFAIRICTNHNIGLYRHPLKTDILSSCTSAY